MKEIKKEVVTKTFVSVYVANDGTEFNNADECKKYDGSAEGVLNARLREIILKDAIEEDIFNYGNDHAVQVVKPTTENDKQIILQMYLLINPRLREDDRFNQLERAQNLIDRAISEDDVLIVGRGYDNDSFWFYGTRNSMKEELDAFVTPQKEEEK